MTSMLVDPVYASTGVSEMTSTEYSQITAAVAALSAKTDIMAMVNSIFGNVIFTTFSDGLTDPRTGAYAPYTGDHTISTWRANLLTHFSSQGISYDPNNDTIVLIMPGIFTALGTTNGYLISTPSGGSFQYTLERLMFHEMAHAASLPTATIADAYLRGNYTFNDPWEADTIAIAAENIIYRQAFSLTGDINGGHDGVARS